MSSDPSLNAIVDYNPVARVLHALFSHSKLLTNVSNYFANLFAHQLDRRGTNFLFSLGVLAVSYKVLHSLYRGFRMWRWVPSHIANRATVTTENLKQKYGDCYAVVTGCTDGIGFAFVLELAKLGFGVVMVARNKEKLERRIVEVKTLHPHFRYEKVIGDLSNIGDVKRVAQELITLSNKVDIGIVINNAGVAGQQFKNFITYDPKFLQNVMNVNFLSSYHINAVMTPLLRSRKSRSAILNVASGAGVYVSQGNGTYSTSKAIFDHYSRTMAIENRDKIDVLTVRPLGVRTPMMKMKKGPFMISPQDCVISSLADLGKVDTTFTGFMHKVQASFLEQMSEQQRLQTYQKLFSFLKK